MYCEHCGVSYKGWRHYGLGVVKGLRRLLGGVTHLKDKELLCEQLQSPSWPFLLFRAESTLSIQGKARNPARSGHRQSLNQRVKTNHVTGDAPQNVLDKDLQMSIDQRRENFS